MAQNIQLFGPREGFHCYMLLSFQAGLSLTWSEIPEGRFSRDVAQITSSPKGNDRSPESNVPRSIWPKTLRNLSPTQMMLHIKFDQDWPTGFRDIQVQKCGIFVTQGQVTPNWVVWFGPNSNLTELLCLSWLPATLMMIQLKMNELAWRHHFPIISLCEIF